MNYASCSARPITERVATSIASIESNGHWDSSYIAREIMVDTSMPYELTENNIADRDFIDKAAIHV